MVEDKLIKYTFFEKPTVGNRVLCKDTALPVSSLRSSLLQDTVRRLLNTSSDAPPEVVHDILSKYASKLINSGHSVQSTRIIIVQGVTKFLHKRELSKLDPSDTRFHPLYLDKSYREEDRQVDKYMAKMEWFKSKKRSPAQQATNEWRNKLTGVWRGERLSQRRVLGRDFTTVVNVPNTRGAELAKALIKAESNLAVMTGYEVKIVEQSGVQLRRLFTRVFSAKSCHWPECPACQNNDSGQSGCKKTNVVYEAVCLECEDARPNQDGDKCKNKRDEVPLYRYIGETSRTVSERSIEHTSAAARLDVNNFIVKHWVRVHNDLESPGRCVPSPNA